MTLVKIVTKSIEKDNKQKLQFTNYASVLLFAKITGFQIVSVGQEAIDCTARKAEFTMCVSGVCHFCSFANCKAYSKNFQ